MPRILVSSVLTLAACALLAGSLAARPQASATPAPQAAPPAQQSEKPTGKVPEGVKLEAQMPAPGAPRPFDFPKPARRVLPDGLEVFVVESHRQPAVTITLLIPAAG